MFNNIEKKIMGLAKVACWLGVAAGAILGVLIAYSNGNLQGVIVGGLAFVLIALASWIASFCLYGFGKLVENSEIVAKSVGKKSE